MTQDPNAPSLPRVVIVGGGVAGLEAALGLHHLAAGRAQVTMVAPTPEFIYKPLVINEPFSLQPAERHELEPALAELGFEFLLDALATAYPAAHEIELGSGSRLGYDYLIVAMGGRAVPAYHRAETFWAARGDLPVDELLADAVAQEGRKLTFAVPPGCSWPLPLYELALMTHSRSRERGPYGVELQIVTPEPAPLAIFGQTASSAVGALLHARGIRVLASSTLSEEPDGYRLKPSGEAVAPGPIVALPAITGPAVPGLPQDGDGFTPIDANAQVKGIPDVYAAGDGTSFPIKQGGIATQQADAAVEHVAARLGAPVEPAPFKPVLRGQLITGPDSLNLSHRLTGGHGEGQASPDYLWWPPGKIAGRYLTPWLSGTSPVESLEPPGHPLDVEVALPQEWHGEPMAMSSHPAPPAST